MSDQTPHEKALRITTSLIVALVPSLSIYFIFLKDFSLEFRIQGVIDYFLVVIVIYNIILNSSTQKKSSE